MDFLPKKIKKVLTFSLKKSIKPIFPENADSGVWPLSRFNNPVKDYRGQQQERKENVKKIKF